jgi:hypothetical protein
MHIFVHIYVSYDILNNILHFLKEYPVTPRTGLPTSYMYADYYFFNRNWRGIPLLYFY